MATQQTKNIDVTKSFVPVDPKAFPETYLVTTKEDSPYSNKPIVAYEGYNFLPTSYGYKSFFGIEGKLDIDALTSKVDEVFIFQTLYLDNIAVALCEDGIWTKDTSSSGAWEHSIVLDIPPEDTVLTWTFCTIEQTIYMYRAQGEAYYVISSLSKLAPQGNDVFVDTAGITLTSSNAGGLEAGQYSYYVSPIFLGSSLGSASGIVTQEVAAGFSNDLAWTQNNADIAGYRIYKVVAGETTYFDFILSAPIVGLTPINYSDYGVDEYLPLLGDADDFAVIAKAGEVYAVVPTFLNMEAQQGLFKAAGTLGFWDSSNSISWANLDDFADFVPAILTNAGNSIFQEVSGKIVQILALGEAFVIYSTNSIVLITSVSSTTQWDSTLLLKGAGIVYPKQACSAVPSTTHYAYTGVGLMSIVKGEAKVIIPEVTDYLKDAKLPTYLRIIEGRYLFLEVMDKDYIDGLVSIYENTVAPGILYYPTTPLEQDPTSITLPAINIPDACDLMQGVTLGRSGEAQDQGEKARQSAEAPPKKEGTSYQPVWTCYLSKGPVGGEITWSPSPCSAPGTLAYPMSPETTVLDPSVRPPLVANSDGYIDGWTMERFVAVQTAIWQAEDTARAAWLEEVSNRVSPVYEVQGVWGGWTGGPASSAPSSEVKSSCFLGAVVDRFTQPVLKITPCSFSLLRLGISKVLLNTQTVIRSRTEVENRWEQTNYGSSRIPQQYYFDGADACRADLIVKLEEHKAGLSQFGEPGTIYYSFSDPDCSTGAPLNGGYVSMLYRGYIILDSGDGTPECLASYCPLISLAISMHNRQRTVVRSQSMNVRSDSIKTLISDAPFCTITGWKYTAVDGSTQIVPASTCDMPYTAPDPDPDNGDSGENPSAINGAKPPVNLVNAGDGGICGISFPAVTIPGINGGNPIDWTTPPSILPATSFLLQKGSIAPYYPTMHGALVYDLQLAKWGKMKQDYKVLIDWRPINTNNLSTIPYTLFGVSGGILAEDGILRVFDENPIDSFIRYGKVGYTRQGFTSAEEIRATFRTPSTGYLVVDSSLNGSTLEGTISKIESFSDATEVIMYPSSSARYHTITFKGKYDIKNLEYRGTTVGNR